MLKDIIIASKDDLRVILTQIIEEFKNKADNYPNNSDQRLNQKEAALFLGITEATLIRWKKKGRVPYEQIPGSSKITFYKSQLKNTLQRNPNLLRSSNK